MTLRAVADEVDAGGRGRIDGDALGVDVLVVPELQQHASERVVAKLGDVRTFGALPRGGDQCIRSIASESLHVRARIRIGLVELDHRFAQRDDIKRCRSDHLEWPVEDRFSDRRVGYALSVNSRRRKCSAPGATQAASFLAARLILISISLPSARAALISVSN